MSNDTKERLQKVMAHAGVASRRKSEEIIRQGRVTVNGQVVTKMGVKVDPDRDEIRVDGREIQVKARHTYVMLHKPPGVLSVMKDRRGRPDLSSLVDVERRLYPVGRLDADSTGLILLTDDGELANLLTHPRYEHEKEYVALVNGRPSTETLDAWRRGVVLHGTPTAPAEVAVLGHDPHATRLRIVMREGRKRQIREVAALLGHPLRELQRVRLGPLELGTLAPGRWRYLSPGEIGRLQAIKRAHRKTKRRGKRGRSRR